MIIKHGIWALVVAQLVEGWLTASEIHGSNPTIGKFYLPIVNLNRKDKNKEKEAGNGPSLKKKKKNQIWDFQIYSLSTTLCRIIKVIIYHSTKS